MSLFTPRRSSTPAAARLGAGLAAALGGMVLSLLPMSPAAAWTPPDLPANPSTSADPDVPLRVRVASFNLLGWSHTPPKGDRTRYRDGVTRMKYAAQIIRRERLEIIGLQEFQVKQWEEWKRQNSLGGFGPGRSYALWPGNALRATPMQNSIAYDTSRWSIVRKETFPVPYSGGTPIAMPYVLLRSKQTGRLIWVINTHNPIDFKNRYGKRIDHTRYRRAGYQMEIDLVRHLERHSPGVPIIAVGDKNQRADYMCRMVMNTDMRSASGGGRSGSTCVTPRGMLVDWVMGNSQVNFSGYRGLRDDLVRKATDHPVVIADALVQSGKVSTSDVRHVVTINVQGLGGSALRENSGVPIPHIRRLASSGASTGNARILSDSASPLANDYAIITGRPGVRSNGGTNAGLSTDHGGTVHQSAGQYVSSALSTIHDTGRRTALWSSDKRWHDRAVTSWNSRYGYADKVGIDNGRDKVSADRARDTDLGAVNSLIVDLRRNRTAYSSLTLSAADRAARRYGPRSPQYARAIRAVDSYIWKLVKAVNGDPALGRRTVLIITSSHGAVKKGYISGRYLAATRVPFVVWGATVARGSNLYALNPDRGDPHAGHPGYGAARQPIRNADAANLATKLLGLPAVPNGRIGAAQTLTVF